MYSWLCSIFTFILMHYRDRLKFKWNIWWNMCMYLKLYSESIFFLYKSRKGVLYNNVGFSIVFVGCLKKQIQFDNPICKLLDAWWHNHVVNWLKLSK